MRCIERAELFAAARPKLLIHPHPLGNARWLQSAPCRTQQSD